ncbi:ABC transporter permease subunit [Streptomyces griseiscabiei]|uniref:ABC transporter permease subunit n=2 Tax=Streptomyces griseiscabiei TaxID=2993540 RepID=A0ABU4KZ65_9ACTN|nr:ABC transporter permease subunit [Streptomyces griseiscabiei]MDX2908780.1 ABC transporter permease subunit [Streptomyces griseiscabiei]
MTAAETGATTGAGPTTRTAASTETAAPAPAPDTLPTPDGTFAGPAAPPTGQAPPPGQPLVLRVSRRKLTILPSVLVVVLFATWVWFEQAELDAISANALSNGQVWQALWQHIRLTVISTFFVLIIAIPLGIALTREAFRKATPVAMTVANAGQATPAIGLLALLVIWLGIGTTAALIGIIAYAVLPVLSNTIAGLKANDPTLLEAARGIGMSPKEVLTRVELPLAVPLILAGVRTALVLNVGTATLATFGGGGGLGVLITTGITNQRMPVLVLGSILTVALALLVDWLASLAEVLLRPRGLETDP